MKVMSHLTRLFAWKVLSPRSRLIASSVWDAVMTMPKAWPETAREIRQEEAAERYASAGAAAEIVEQAAQAMKSSIADEALGRLIRETLDTRRGDGSGTQYRDDLVASTIPGSPERAYQDRLLDASIRRLHGAMPAILKAPVRKDRPAPRTFCGIDYSATPDPTFDGVE